MNGFLLNIGDNELDIIVISRFDYEKLTTMDCWEEDAKSVIQTSCFYIGNAEVYESPHLSIKLKKEDDIDLLNSYVERYKPHQVYSTFKVALFWELQSMASM